MALACRLTIAIVLSFSACRGDGGDGAELARRHCQGCHMLPDPGLLDRETWRIVLPWMGYRLGVYPRPGLLEDSLLEAGWAGERVRQARVFPDRPVISGGEWKALVDHYLAAAPERLPEPPRPGLVVGLKRFRVRIPEFRTDPPMTTLVKIDPARGRIYLGDTKQDFSTLEVLDRHARPVQTVGLESAPAHLRIVGDSVYALLMGRFLPTDEPSGLLRVLVHPAGELRFNQRIRRLDSLARPVHASYADLNGDGREDVVLSEFGNLVGRLAWYERTATGSYTPHVLRPLPGAIATDIRDVNGDGRPDVLALMAQGDEGVFLYENQGGGRFRERRLLQFPPSYGSTWMEVTDFNQDGRFDLLHATGDNGDYRPVRKPYHGVRVFLNEGRDRFHEAFFFPLQGAYRTSARDFDADGDLDIVAIAFYADFQRAPREGFVYLENTGGMRFEASTFAEADRGRWITFDVGDLDRDEDLDVVLGSFVGFAPTEEDTVRWRQWVREGPSIIVLEYATR